MSTFVMLTRLESEATHSPEALLELEQHAMRQVRKECPKVTWVTSYATPGPYDYVDIFQAADVETATKVATLIRSFGHAHTEIWPATEWARYKEMVRTLPTEA